MTAIKAELPVYGGYVMARAEGVIFIKGAVPGELVEVSVKERKKDYSVAEVTSILEPSSFRVVPPCEYFGSCGGCQLQYISYEKQVSMKGEVLSDSLRRIGGIEFPLSDAFVGKNFKYRLRGQFKLSGDGRIGFYKEGTRDIVDIDECPLMVDEINEVYKKLRSVPLESVKEAHITSGDGLTVLIIGRGFDEGLSGRLMSEGFSGVAFEDGSYSGSGYVSLELSGLSYTVSPWSFFQSNWALNQEVVKLIVGETAGLSGKCLDMYAGAGNFSLPLASTFSEIVAVEENAGAIKDGMRNASINGIKNFRYLKGGAESAKVEAGFDLLILDPPRPGLTKEAMSRVKQIAARNIIYVSCNPATFARDLKKLKDAYNLESVRLIDFFPNTYHIESVAFLEKKTNQ